jgi:hypothetical protein
MAVVRVARRSPLVSVLVVALLIAAAVITRQQFAFAASNLPADKMTVTASSTSVQGPGTDVPVLSAQMKTSTPADLLLQVTSECTILSQITNMGTSTQNYIAKVELWLTVDGNPVPVVPNATGTGATTGSGGADDGSVVFCNREFTRTTTFNTNNESIKDVENTEQSNAFQWVALNVGNGVHTIVVHARFTDTNGTDTFAHGVIDKRSLTAQATNYFISQPSA